MILFEKIRWKNFLSTGNQFTEVELNKESTTLIIGNNGAGKSTILDALTFVLFGKSFRKINKPQLINSTNEKDGAYSVVDEDGEQVLYIFQEEDDATRYALQLEELDYPEMHVLEIEDDIMIKTCEIHDHRYTIITPNDIVIPPDDASDYL